MNKELIHRVFESRIGEYGELLALESAEGEVSYVELNAGSNRVGHMLKDMGLQ
ncbi:MAG: hypothetical protein JNM19_06255, partial [Chitinophagaceae bacterium]|nr:hypothetical protein [Chitinophagaceae bacterium]